MRTTRLARCRSFLAQKYVHSLLRLHSLTGWPLGLDTPGRRFHHANLLHRRGEVAEEVLPPERTAEYQVDGLEVARLEHNASLRDNKSM